MGTQNIKTPHQGNYKPANILFLTGTPRFCLLDNERASRYKYLAEKYSVLQIQEEIIFSERFTLKLRY